MVDTLFKLTNGDKLLARGFTRQVFTEANGSLLYHIPDVVAEKFAHLHAHAFSR